MSAAEGYAVCDSAEPWASGAEQSQATLRDGFKVHRKLDGALSELVAKGWELGSATPERVRILATDDGESFRLLCDAESELESWFLAEFSKLLSRRFGGAG